MLPCDVTDEASVTRLVETVLKEAGSIDLLVNNAARNFAHARKEADWFLLCMHSTVLPLF